MTPDEFLANEMRSADRDERPCAKMCDRWVHLRTGLSPIELAGEEHDTAEDADRMIAERALPIRVARAMRRAGFARTTEPEPGAIGIIATNGLVICALRTSRNWVFRTEHGFCALAPETRCIASWTIA